MKEKKIEREPYTGDVIDINKPLSKDQATTSSGEPSAANAGFHNRPATRAGLCSSSSLSIISYLIFISFVYLRCKKFIRFKFYIIR